MAVEHCHRSSQYAYPDVLCLHVACRHLGAAGGVEGVDSDHEPIDVDYGGVLFEVKQLDATLDL